VLGIVASRLVEKFNKPVILLREGEGNFASGSARSVAGIDITQAITAQADILHKFGGHPMAAGLSLPTELIPDFRQRISHTIRKMTTPGTVSQAELTIEATLTLADVFGGPKSKKAGDSFQILEELETLAPYGNGNPAPVFCIEKVHIAESAKIGVAGDHLAITVEDVSGQAGRVIWWQGGGEILPEGWFNLACTIHMNEFGGKRVPQLEWVDAQPIPEETQSDLPVLRIQYFDYRQSINPIADLVRLRAEKPDLQIWAEGPNRKEVNGVDRNNLKPGDSLVLWTTPPGSQEMDQVIEKVHPRFIYLMCVDPSLDKTEPFLKRLAGLLSSERTLRQQPVRMELLAAAMSHRPVTVELGLRTLAEIGKITIQRMDQNGLEYDILSGMDLNAGKIYHKQLQFSLQETAAFRRSIKQQSVEQWRRQFFPSVQRKGLTNHPNGG
jgi:single-stranded-DNA-specific exonuclease